MSPVMLRRKAPLLAGVLAILFLALLSWRLLGRRPEREAARAEADRSEGLPEAPGARSPRAIVPDLPVKLLEPPLPTAAASAGTFEGRVVSAATGGGVAGAEITFSRSGEANSVRAAGDGTFSFQPRLPGRWILAAVTAPGFIPFAPEWGHSPVLLDARDGAHVRGITIALAPAVEYLGRVTDAAGQPVAAAEVRILGAAVGETALLPMKERFSTDAAGEFRFQAPDGAVLEARHAEHGSGSATVDFSVRVSRRLTIALQRAAEAPRRDLSIAGRVEDPSGSPQDGAVVVARRERAGDPPQQASTDALGRFSVSGLAPGTYRLVAARPGFAPAVERGVDAGATELVLRLRMGGRLSGRVRNLRTGEPVAPFTVAVRSRGRERRSPLRTLAVVDAGGRYEMDDLAPGPAAVVVAAPGHAPSSEVLVTIPEPGQPPATADFDLASGGRIHGFVLDARSRQPLPGASIELEGQIDFGPSALPVRALASAGVGGRFELAGVPAGPASLSASAEGHHARILSGVVVREGESRGPVTIELTPLAEGEDPKLELTGIGATLAQRRDSLAIVSVLPAGGAAEAGLGPGDEVLRIDGALVNEMTFAAAVNLIRGPEDSAVVLGVRKRSDPQTEQRVVVYRRLVRN